MFVDLGNHQVNQLIPNVINSNIEHLLVQHQTSTPYDPQGYNQMKGTNKTFIKLLTK
jgi:hypothetical protein